MITYTYNHTGIPTNIIQNDEIYLPHLKMYVTDHLNNPARMQWIRFEEGADYPEIVKTRLHLAFIVEDLEESLVGKNVIIKPNSPSAGLTVAFIEENGEPIELMQVDKAVYGEI
jgi:hypothetical protein